MNKNNQETVVKAPSKRELMERLARLEKALSQQTLSVSRNEYISDVRPDEYINVMSLLDIRLTLSTLGYGKGKTFKFENFGQTKRIPYSDLVQIIENHKNFLEWGYFYILDERVVRVNGLEDIYKNILTKEKIEQVLDGKGDVVSIYKSANQNQKEIINSIIIERLTKNPNSMDLNLVDKISRIGDINLLEKSQEAVEFAKIMQET
jgi:hypothetical protein